MNSDIINKATVRVILCLLIPFMWACTFETEPVNYGKDSCGFCKMSVVEDRYACEIVTDKGKVFKFDDLSCMIRFMVRENIDKKDMAHVVVNDFSHPHGFLDVDLAVFLSGSRFTGPMNGDVAAFKTMEAAEEVRLEDPGVTLLNWEDVIKKFK